MAVTAGNEATVGVKMYANKTNTIDSQYIPYNE